MAYPVNIVINNRNWYDSRISVSDPVVFQNVNYATGDDRSVNVVRQRFMQDWARQIIPNSVRQGLGLTDPAGGSDEIVVTQGFAVVGGRFIDIPAGTYDASVEGLTSSKFYYLVIKVTDFTEGDTRLSSAGSAALIAQPLTSPSYVKNHNELVVAKFFYTGAVINSFEDYTAEMEWQASVLSPIPARPGLSTGSDQILIRAGDNERINNLGIETDKTRFYLNAVFNDQDGSPVEELKLINTQAVLEITDLTHDDFLGVSMFNLSTGVDISGTATERLDELGNLLNIGTINSRTMGGNSATDLIDTNSTQTMTDKTLTAPIVTTGTFGTPLLTTPHIVDANTEKYTFAVSDLAADRQITLPLLISNDTFVFEDHIQTLDNKTLTADSMITSFYTDSIGGSDVLTFPTSITDTLVSKTTTDTLSNKKLTILEFFTAADVSESYTIAGQALSANRILTIPTAVADTFMMLGAANTMTSGSTLSFAGDNDFLLGAGQWTGAQHDHTAGNDGGTIHIVNATTNTLTTSRGGTGLTGFGGEGKLFYTTGSSTMAVLSNPGAARLLVSQVGVPAWQTSPTINITYGTDLSGSTDSGVMNASGDWTINVNPSVVNNSHEHTQINTNTEVVVYSPYLMFYSGGFTIESDSNHNELHITSTGSESGEMMIPYIVGKTITRVAVRIFCASTQTMYIRLLSHWDGSTSSASTEISEIVTNAWETFENTTDRSDSTEYHTMTCRIRSAGAVDCSISALIVTYSN